MRKSLAFGLREGRVDRRFAHESSGLAAVEFALILPLMITMYLGCAELSQGLEVTRKATIVASSLADLISEQSSGVTLTNTVATDAFAAASAIISPYPTSTLKMTLSSVEFVTNAHSSTGFDAKVRWTTAYNGGTPRPCQIMTPVANSATPTPTTIPTGIYPSSGSAAATAIVADATYIYTPTFGGSVLAWSSSATSITFNHSAYMRPRNEYSVAYSGTNCAAY